MTDTGPGVRPALSIAPALAGDVRYGPLQVMADELMRHDPVVTLSSEERGDRWRHMLTQVEALLRDHADVRLHLLRYRAVLATQGLLASGALLLGWAEAIRDTPPTDVDAADRDVIGAALGHFLTDDHLQEWQSADMAGEGGPAVRSVFEQADVQRPAKDSRRRAAPIGDPAARAVTQWLHGSSDVLSRIADMRAAIDAVAQWLHGHAPLAELVQRERVTPWLTRLHDALVTLGAPTAPASPIPSPAGIAAPGAPPLSSTLDGQGLQREDIMGLLQTCIRWFAQNEPGHPAPYFLQRVVTLMDADFHDILRALLPEAVPHFRALAGMEES